MSEFKIAATTAALVEALVRNVRWRLNEVRMAYLKPIVGEKQLYRRLRRVMKRREKP